MRNRDTREFVDREAVKKMNLEKIRIDGIPSILWGDASEKIIIVTHGSHSSKIDDCIWILAEEAVKRGYQVLSFDLPQHGERVYETDILMPDECVRELKTVYAWAKRHARQISLFGCSMGAYFQLLTFADAEIDKVWFLSPVTDMERIIHNLMEYCHVSEEEFRQRTIVENDLETLYYPYYEYVRTHPIAKWPHRTCILRGEYDSMSEFAYVKAFSDRFDCELMEQKNGEHWFHTEEQLAVLDAWIRKEI